MTQKVDINKVTFNIRKETLSNARFFSAPSYAASVDMDKQRFSAQVLDMVCETLSINIEKVKSGCRLTPFCEARFIFWHLMKGLSPVEFSLSELGVMFGKDHATVLHGIRKAQNYYDVDIRFKLKMDRCVSQFKRHFNTVESYSIDFTAIPQY